MSMRCLHYLREAKVKAKLCRSSQQTPQKPYAETIPFCYAEIVYIHY